jgi:3-dehydroquinate synthase
MTEPIPCDVRVHFHYEIAFTEGVFALTNPLLAQILTRGCAGRTEECLIIVEASILQKRPTLIAEMTSYFAAQPELPALACEPLTLPGGESLKASHAPVDRLYEIIERHGLSRHSYVIAIGGGALLDVVGFAAATAHRGIRHLRLPTTTLSQADGGVGIKNGINAFGKKNFIGTFVPPFAVINDFDFIGLLPNETKSAGYIEAVKVALIRDAAFFEEIARDADDLIQFEATAMQRLIRRCAELHIRQIARGGDPFEFGSARPLDFGHWSAHKLEQLSGFKIGHAQAVAIGIALDVVYSRRAGFLDSDAADRILALLEKLGFGLFAAELLDENERGERAVLAGLTEFREHLGGELTITLLREIGVGFEIHEMSPEMVLGSIEELAERDRRK